MPDFPAPFSTSQPFFQTSEPITFQLQANEEAARRRSAANAGAGAPPPAAPAGGAQKPDPRQVFQTLSAAVTNLGEVLNKGQDVSSALATLANALATFTTALNPAAPPPQNAPAPAQNAGVGQLPPALRNPPPAPPTGIAPPNPSAGPNQAFIELPVGAERGGLPPQPVFKPEPPVGLYPASAGAPAFWTV
ncbi:MAG: hypothetical protein FJZ01_22200 [Candidatus Sericytochromatia bacterium]|nr:hypothetical protein [Candidatus Tanganyikabacteria bacterium]